jgi:hypothetical protein
VAEILRGPEARQVGDARRIELGVGQELLRALDPQGAHVPFERHPLALDEELGKVTGSKPREPRHRLERERLREVPVDVIDRATQAPILARPHRSLHRFGKIENGTSICRKEVGDRSGFSRGSVQHFAKSVEALLVDGTVAQKGRRDLLEARLEVSARRVAAVTTLRGKHFEVTVESGGQKIGPLLDFVAQLGSELSE